MEAFISDTVVPTKANVIATFKLAKKKGKHLGTPILINMSFLFAPKTLRTSSSSGYNVDRPVAMLTMIGKKLMRNAVNIAGPAPIPNQTTRIGTNAAFGSALNAVIKG